MPRPAGPPERRANVAFTIYIPPDLYDWLVLRKAHGHGPLTKQIVGYCHAGRARDEAATEDGRPVPSPTPGERAGPE